MCSSKERPTEIPIFFSTDDNYIPFLDVAIRSLIDHADRSYRYRILILHTGLAPEGMELIRRNADECFAIDFVDISSEVERIASRLKNVYHFSVVTYYRLFIASLFPVYDKAIYLDCDLVVLGNIARLYEVELGENILGAAPEQFVRSTSEFRLYAEKALGVDPDTYVNAGVLLMNLAQFRKNRIEERFIELIREHDFDLLDPDQAYLNYLCAGRIRELPNGWNLTPLPTPCEGEMRIVHYALYKKPWQYDDVLYGEHFWNYAKRSPFYPQICRKRQSFGGEEQAQKEAGAREILLHALRIVDSEHTFSKILCRA